MPEKKTSLSDAGGDDDGDGDDGDDGDDGNDGNDSESCYPCCTMMVKLS